MSVCTTAQMEKNQNMALKATEDARRLLKERGIVDPRISSPLLAMENPEAFWAKIDQYDNIFSAERQRLLVLMTWPAEKKEIKPKHVMEYTQDWASRAYA